MARDTFEHSLVGSPGEIADYLTALAAGLQRGQITLESSGHAMRIVAPAEIKLELHAEEKPEKGKLKLEIRWKRPSATKLSELTIEARPVLART
jgi:amphi-Trp domain-containing protein